MNADASPDSSSDRDDLVSDGTVGRPPAPDNAEQSGPWFITPSAGFLASGRRHYHLLVVPHMYRFEHYDPVRNLQESTQPHGSLPAHESKVIRTIGVEMGITKDTKLSSAAEYPLHLWWADAAQLVQPIQRLAQSMGLLRSDESEYLATVASLGGTYLPDLMTQHLDDNVIEQFTVHRNRQSFDSVAKDGQVLTAEEGIGSHDVLVSVDSVPLRDYRSRVVRLDLPSSFILEPFHYRTEGLGKLPDGLTGAVASLFDRHRALYPAHRLENAPLSSTAAALHQLLEYVGCVTTRPALQQLYMHSEDEELADAIKAREPAIRQQRVASELNTFLAANYLNDVAEIRFGVFPTRQIGEDYKAMRSLVATPAVV